MTTSRTLESSFDRRGRPATARGGRRPDRILRGGTLVAGLLVLTMGGALTAPSPVHAWARTLTVTFYNSDGYGDGKGRVTSDDGAIDCSYNAGVTSGDCSEPYIIADFFATYDATLTLDPDPGSYVCLSAQSLCQPDGATRTFPIHFDRGTPGDLTVNPSFNLRTYRVQFDAIGPGSVSGNGAFCPVGGNIDYCGEFKYGASAAINATPAQGSSFGGWSGGPCLGQDATCAFTVTDASTAQVYFDHYRVVLEAGVGGDVCAWYFPSGTKLYCVGGGHGPVVVWPAKGSQLWIEGQKYPDTHFVRWNTDGPCAGQEAVCEWTVDRQATIKAFFAEGPAPTPTPRITPKPTVKPSPTAPASTPAPSSGPAGTTSPSPGPSTPPGPTASSGPLPTAAATGLPDGSGALGSAPPAATPPSSSAPPTVDSGSSGSPPGLTLVLLVVLALAVASAGIGLVMRRRSTRPRA